MSKYVKNLVADHLRRNWDGINDALLVNVVGLEANASGRLRGELEAKQIHLMVVKNSVAARAAVGTPLAPMFEGMSGTAAVCWGGEDIVGLAKEVARLASDKTYEAFQARGGVMDGERLTAQQVIDVSRWPSREEQLSLLVGQILGPGATLAAQLIGPGGALASQIAQKAEGEEAEAS
jgi:large subunit ribosomal protein L10